LTSRSEFWRAADIAIQQSFLFYDARKGLNSYEQGQGVSVAQLSVSARGLSFRTGGA